MDGFLRTAAFLLAGLFLLLVAAGVTALVMLKGKGVVGPEQFRDLVLSKEERTWLAAMKDRPEEPAEKKAPAPTVIVERMPEGEILERIAQRVNADRATEVLEQMRRQKASLDERQAQLDRQVVELGIARADLQRLRRQIEERDQELRAQRKSFEDERMRWALAQADAVKRTEALAGIERERYREQVRIYEQMKDGAWQSLRRFEPREIARYLKLMDPKKAARMLTLAEQDREQPGLATAIQKAMLTIDLEAPSTDLVAHLATLYSFMKGDQVAGYLAGSTPQQVVQILRAMDGQAKKQAEIIEALRRADAERAAEIERQLSKTGAQSAS